MRFQDFKVLSDQEIVQIHEASISILENTGVMIHSRKALDLLNSKGANVDYDKKLVKISGKMVESCLKTLPKTIDENNLTQCTYLCIYDHSHLPYTAIHLLPSNASNG